MNYLIACGKKWKVLALLAFLTVPTFLSAQLIANFTLDKQGGCSPLSVSFTNQTVGASANAVYQWDFGNGNTSTLANPGAIYTEAKTYTVTLTVTDGAKTSSKSATVTVYKNPKVDFSVNAPKICIPAAATFNVTASAGDGYVSSYYWDFGDGTTQQAYSNTINHYYNYEQKPNVSLTVANSYGCYNSITKTEMVEILGRIEPRFSSDKTMLCTLDESIQLSNTSTGPGTLLYNWDFGDGTTSTKKNPDHQFTKKAVFPVKLTVSNTDGCSVTGYPVSINAAYFNTNFSYNPLCRELSFQSSGYLYPDQCFWKFGNGASAYTYASTNYTYSAAGTYDVTLINTYGQCKDSVTKTVKVEDNVNFNSTLESPASVCEGSYTTFKSKSSVSPGNIVWDFGDGYSYSSWTETSHVYYTPGTYTIKLTNTFGTCKETVTKQITVNPMPNLNGFVVDYGGVCGSPVTVKFKDTTVGAAQWQWKQDYYYSTVFSSQQNSSLTFNNDGNYYISLMVTTAAGCSKSVSKNLYISRPNVYTYPLYSSGIYANYDCDSLTIKMAASSTQAITKYNWSFGDGYTSMEAIPQHSFKTPGNYNITLNYTTESNCTGSAVYPVRVYNKPKAAFNYSVPCGNSLNLYFNDVSYFSDNWEWKFGDGYDSYHSSPTHPYSDTGKYMVRFINHIGHCADTITKEVYANVLPSYVRITKAETTCDGNRNTVTLDQSSLRISSGTWNFGDGTTMPYDTSAHNITHIYARTGSYNITLTGISGNCTLTDNRGIKILLKQNPLLTANKTEICSNDNISVQISNLETNPYTNSEWWQYSIERFEYNTGLPYSGYLSNYNWRYTTYSASLSNFTPGTTKLRAIIKAGSTDCYDTTNYINLKVNGPIASFKVLNDGVCYKSAIEFEDKSKTLTSTPLKTWYWDFGDGENATYTSSSKIKHLYKLPGTYYVQITVTDVSGCVSSHGYSVSAKGPKASFYASGLHYPNVPLNTNITFYNSTNYWYSNSVNYLWDYGDGNTSTNYQGEHTYTQAGINIVKLIAADPSISCADTAVQVVTVKDFNTAFTFNTNFIASNSCPPVTVSINNLSVGYTSLVWDFGDGTTISNQAYPSHTYNKPGVYRITLTTYGYNGLTGTYRDSVTITEASAQIDADILSGCAPQRVSLTADAVNTASYLWDFGDGTVNNGTGLTSHQYVTGGIYLPRLILKNSKGCMKDAALAEKIIIDSLQIAIKGIPPLICDSTTIFFTPEVKSIAEQAGKTLTYHWDFGTGNAADTSNIKNAVFNFNKPGTYVIRFKVASPLGCTEEVTEQVIVNKKARASITGPNELCAGSSATFAGSASQSPVQWSWNFDNGHAANVQNPASQKYNTAGTYNVQLVVQYKGCYDTAKQLLMVHANPVTHISTPKKLLCRGETIQLIASGGVSYAWNPATGLSNAAIPDPLATPLQNIQYKVEVTNQFGCTTPDSMQLTVAQPISISLPAETFVCKGSGVQLKAQGAYSYQWINSIAGLSNTHIANPVASPAATTTYTVVGTDVHDCFKDTADILVKVQALPTVTAEPDVQMLAAETHQLTATASSDVTYWLWTPEDFLSCTQCPSPVVKPRIPVDYVVTVKNSYGCAAYDTIKIKLECLEDFVFIPNSFTPGTDGKNDIFYIKGKGIGIIKSLVIYNRWGEKVFEKRNFSIDDRNAGWDGKLKGMFVPAGSYPYFAEMQCDGGQPILKKGTVTVIY